MKEGKKKNAWPVANFSSVSVDITCLKELICLYNYIQPSKVYQLQSYFPLALFLTD